MKVAVIYRSMTGHSKKIANAVAKELGVEAASVKGSPKLKSVDLLFIVGGIYSGESLPELISYVKSLKPNQVKRVALITSSLTKRAGQAEVRKLLESNNIEVVDEEYHCCGNFLFIKMGHPSKQEIQGAVDFAKGLVKSKN